MNASDIASASNVRQSLSSRVTLLAVCALLAPLLAAWLLPPFAQPQSFHDYADQRVWLGFAACGRRAVEPAVPCRRRSRASLRVAWLAHEEPSCIFGSACGVAIRAAVLRRCADRLRLCLVSRTTERRDSAVGPITDGVRLCGTGRRHFDGSRSAADFAVAARVCDRRCRHRALLAGVRKPYALSGDASRFHRHCAGRDSVDTVALHACKPRLCGRSFVCRWPCSSNGSTIRFTNCSAVGSVATH